ncbi:DNA-binding protein [Streptomyces sp. NBC_00083]|uniref:DNA-binding protein n=1 Tax=Streptomyces sp. NBC_00083 TaxID=2975647 RepID=UPI002255D3C1|nr:DNA-binding protein [Streptomyces sp. NBC_00083]MCX5383828.1 DNA-binding protein [Streptomyces sp. NBC_00083]
MTRASHPPAVVRDGTEHGLSAAEALRAARHLVTLDAVHGATAALPTVRRLLHAVPQLTAAPAIPPGADSDLLAALAELCEVIGWILFDAGLDHRAHRMNLRALALAERCGDRAVARLVLLNHSMLHTHRGRPRAALATVAKVAGPRPLPTLIATLVLVRRAHAIALLGGHREAGALVSRARCRFLDGASRLDPPWSWWIDQPELTGHHGWVLARLHDWDHAIPLLYEAATTPGPSYRHLFTAELLAALAGAGAWREAEDLITDLAPRAPGIGSVRTTQTLARTAAHLRDRAAAPVNLRDAAAFLLESVPPHPEGRDRPSR